ncbi:lysophospholipid acyltransferase family protein [Desulfatitalea alkaliphila]|uniref:Lysophospholipid acyltransferase family protein n=1 Tax=Desulfatitalea alkaliphila TaxID=2929485 RepID=A0AA41R2W9_9BACT|nr:lysophospholipid acyltransferase family protein [Desulfatitalea alkaliphila]MCJ8500736.1 lysophospholipid acyltransferase family protein [Desulfatitalea alkaliphila]
MPTRNLSYRLIKGVITLLARVPRPLMARLAVPVGRLWYSLDRRHRTIAADNMARAMGDTFSERQRERLLRANFIQLATTALEMPSLLHLSRDNLDQYALFEGVEHVIRARDQGKGVLLLTGHFGNWELFNLVTALKFGPGYALARPLDYAPMDRVLNEIRTRTGNTMVDKQDSANRVRQLLRDKQMVGILLDQNASWYEGVYVRFFGQPACTNKGMAMFALRYGTPVVPAYNIRGRDGRYNIIFEPPLPMIKTGDTRRDILDNTLQYNRAIENFIRKAPDHWFWVHRRWRIIGVPEKARDKIVVDDGIELDLSQ